MLRIAAILYALLIPGSVLAQPAPAADGDVRLLKFPHPYSSALTVQSDMDGADVAKFQAVHRLINSTERIDRDCETWKLLLGDPAIDRDPAWKDGFRGFGLPFSDSVMMYRPAGLGVFASFDYQTGQPVPQGVGGRDMRDYVDEWFGRGWIDTLHTFGPGDLRRQAAQAGVDWLHAKPGRKLKIWVNHSITATPVCLGPYREPALKIIVKNTVKFMLNRPRPANRELPMDFRESSYPIISFPVGQRLSTWSMLVAFLLSTLGLLTCAVIRPLRTRRNLLVAVGVMVVLGLGLWFLGLNYALGDKPYSPYYVADLLRPDFRYYWLVVDVPGCRGSVPDQLWLPENKLNGRDTVLGVYTLYDGAPVLVYGRNYKGRGGLQSLELLTAENLQDLCNRQGTSIIYTHWTGEPKTVFTAKALEGLAQLRRFYGGGKVWLARTVDLLDFTYARTFLDYQVRQDGGKRLIDIRRINTPLGPAEVPQIDDLSGISFDCPSDMPLEVLIDGKPVPAGTVKTIPGNVRTIIQFPLRPGAKPG